LSTYELDVLITYELSLMDLSTSELDILSTYELSLLDFELLYQLITLLL